MLGELARVRRILRGDRRAGEIFVAEHYPAVRRMLWCLTGDAEATADLTQQTFVKAWQALDTYRGEARLATWLHQIAYREYTHWLRDRHPTASLGSIGDMADPRAVHDLKTILLSRALEQLPAELRDTFLLFYAHELSVREVAAVQGVAPGTVKSRLFAARARLRELLAEPALAADAAGGSPMPVL
jgi:RNA polymerase sigma-70 factor (ECF subfamily)